MLQGFLDSLGEPEAADMSDQMDVEFKVPAIDFSKKGQGAVASHYAQSNTILQKHKMKITMDSYWAPDQSWWSKLMAMVFGEDEKSEKSLIGNTKGTFKEADIDAYGKEVDKLIDTFKSPGKISSFLFADFIEDVARYGPNRQLHGQAVRAKSKAKYQGKEAVFMDINAAGHVFVHELGHIIGGAGEEAEHTGAQGDPENIMYHQVQPGTDQTALTQAQINAFKTGIYATISKVKTAPPPAAAP